MIGADAPGPDDDRAGKGRSQVLSEYSQEELIAKWEEFFAEMGYESAIIGLADRYPEARSLKVRFDDLNRFDTDMSIHLLRHPLNVLAAGEEAIRRIVPPTEEAVEIHLRILGLPRDSRVQIRDLRAKHLGRSIAVEGLVRKATEVRPMVVDALFQCLRCGTVTKEPQEGQAFREPLECYEDQGGCGKSASSTKFKLLSEASRFLDTQKIEIQEAPEGLRGGEEPQRLAAFMEDDLTGQITPGMRVILNGILRSSQKGRPGQRSTLFDIFLDTNSIELEQVEFEEIEVTEEDIKRIEAEAAEPDIFLKIVASIAPSIYGLSTEKEALALQLFSGVPKLMPDGRRIRGDLHLLLVGDPGTAKSELLSYMSRLSPRGIYATGKAATAAGLTAAAVRDEFGEGRWTLEAGALVLADKGLACLHPDAEIVLDGVPVVVEEIFDETRAVTATAGGHEIEICQLDAETIGFNPRRLVARRARVAFVARRRYIGPVLRVRLDSGFQLRLTPDHLALDGDTMEWKRLGDLKPGSRLVGVQKLPGRDEPIHLLDILPGDWILHLDPVEKSELRAAVLKRFPHLAEARRAYGLKRDALSGRGAIKVNQFRRIVRESKSYSEWRRRALGYGRGKATERLRVTTITPELAYVLGFIYGDGHVSITSKHSSVSVFQSATHLRYIQQILRASKAVSSRPWGMHERMTRTHIRGRLAESRAYHMHRGSNLIAFLYDWLTSNDLSNLLRLDDDALSGFIAGLMDSDGSISVRRSKRNSKAYENVDIEFLFSSSPLANQRFLLALRRFDIFARIREARGVLRVQITSRADAERLLSAIARYSAKARQIPAGMRRIAGRRDEAPRGVAVRLLKEIHPTPSVLLAEGVWSTFHDLRAEKRRPTKSALGKLAKTLRRWMTPDQRRRMAALSDNDYVLEKIAEIRVEDHEGYVYDLRVPDTDNFLCDGIVVHNCIDEIDKMNPQDRAAIHEAMEQQRISVAKAGITAVLQARCAVLGAANPKFGRFDEAKYIAEQIDLPPTLLSRFDAIFSIIDRPESEKDRRLADHILRGHLVGEWLRRREEGREVPEANVEYIEHYAPHFDPIFFRKYVAYSKRISPVMKPEAVDAIRTKYLEIRKTGEAAGASVPITPRQLEAIIRLAEASARARLSSNVEAEDAERAVRITEYWMRRVAGEEGRFDIDIVQVGISASQREQIITLREIITELSAQSPLRAADYEDIARIASERGISSVRVDQWLKRWAEEGEVYSPSKNKYKLVERL
ncbi:MAG TPA: LAGLIDADG family homing endonuclease [Thermoplasmata archaeon]|nr:LAGLIDADG family homing endonuclease [Thermoplasmata archaeon]